MFRKLLKSAPPAPDKRDQLRNLARERHFEALLMQSWTEMRARAPR